MCRAGTIRKYMIHHHLLAQSACQLLIQATIQLVVDSDEQLDRVYTSVTDLVMSAIS